MKKTLLLTGLLLALTSAVSMASGVNFAWGTLCYTENPVNAAVFACNTNTFAAGWPMIASFATKNEIPDFVGVEILIEGQSDQPALPDWWKLGAGTDCRLNQATFASDFSTVANVCLDWTGGVAFNVFAYTWDTNKGHISAGAALDASTPMVMPAETEFYAGKISVKNNKTVGTGACTGCSFGMIWGLYSVVAAGLSGQRETMMDPIANQCLIWNNSVQPCAAPVPARNTTWGQVKSLYR